MSGKELLDRLFAMALEGKNKTPEFEALAKKMHDNNLHRSKYFAELAFKHYEELEKVGIIPPEEGPTSEQEIHKQKMNQVKEGD